MSAFSSNIYFLLIPEDTLREPWEDVCIGSIGALGRSLCDVCSAFKYILFDRPPRQLLGRIAPISSSRDSASALRDCGLIEAAGYSVHVIASIVLLALIVAAVGGGDLILKQRLQLRLYARYRRFRRCPDKVRLGAARGDPGEVRREANPSSIPKP